MAEPRYCAVADKWCTCKDRCDDDMEDSTLSPGDRQWLEEESHSDADPGL